MFIIGTVQRTVRIWNRDPGHIQGFFPSVKNDFDVGRIQNFRRTGHRHDDIGAEFRFSGKTFGNCCGYVFPGDQGLIPIDLHIEISLDLPGSFLEPMGGTAVGILGKDSGDLLFFTELKDFPAVCGHPDFFQVFCFFGPFINMLDHRLSINLQQRLARKPGRSVSCGNDSNCSHIYSSY